MGRKVILILGAHRSGTSALTRVLSILGAELPKTILGKGEGNETGHWESKPIMRHHGKILAELNSEWSDWRPLDVKKIRIKDRNRFKSEMADIFESEYADQNISVVKEPRISRFASLYIEALQDLGIEISCVIPVRNPLESAASLTARDNIPASKGLLLWLTHMLEAERATRDLNRAFISFPELISNPETQLKSTLATLGIELPYSVEDTSQQLRTFLSPKQKHHSHTSEDICLNSLTRTWFNDAFSAFAVLCNNHQSKEAISTLDNVWSSFNDATDYIYTIQNEYNAAQNTLRSTLEEQRKEQESAFAELTDLNEKSKRTIISLQDQCTHKQKELETKRQELNNFTQKTNQQMAALREDSAQLQNQLKATQKELDNLNITTQEKVAALSDGQAQKQKELESARKDLEALREKTNSEIIALREGRAQKQKELASARKNLKSLREKTNNEIIALREGRAQKQKELKSTRSDLNALNKTSNKAIRKISDRYNKTQLELKKVHKELQSQIKTSSLENKNLNTDLAQKQAAVAATEKKFARLKKSSMREADRLAARIDKLTHALKIAKESSNNLVNQNEELKGLVTDQNVMIDDLIAQKEEMLRSKSWRFTSGFRKGKGLYATAKQKSMEKLGLKKSPPLLTFRDQESKD